MSLCGARLDLALHGLDSTQHFSNSTWLDMGSTVLDLTWTYLNSTQRGSNSIRLDVCLIWLNRTRLYSICSRWDLLDSTQSLSYLTDLIWDLLDSIWHGSNSVQPISTQPNMGITWLFLKWVWLNLAQGEPDLAILDLR